MLSWHVVCLISTLKIGPLGFLYSNIPDTNITNKDELSVLLNTTFYKAPQLPQDFSEKCKLILQ